MSVGHLLPPSSPLYDSFPLDSSIPPPLEDDGISALSACASMSAAVWAEFFPVAAPVDEKEALSSPHRKTVSASRAPELWAFLHSILAILPEVVFGIVLRVVCTYRHRTRFRTYMANVIFNGGGERPPRGHREATDRVPRRN